MIQIPGKASYLGKAQSYTGNPEGQTAESHLPGPAGSPRLAALVGTFALLCVLFLNFFFLPPLPSVSSTLSGALSKDADINTGRERLLFPTVHTIR